MIGVLLFILALLLIGPFLVPAPTAGEASERALADPDSQFAQINGLTIHYKERGAGDRAFVLLHGFGASAFSWHAVMEPLSELGRVVAYDRPAFGLTSRPMPGSWKGESPYGLASNVELLAGLMDALGIEKATFICNSAGCAVSVAFALKYPSRVESLILVDPALGNNGGRMPAWALPLLATPQLRHLGPLFVRNIATSGNDTIKMAWHAPAKISPETFDGYRKPLKAYRWDAALYEFTIAARPSDLVERLGELTMPILVLTGDDDRIVPTQSTIELAAKIPGAALKVIPACGHVPHEEKPDEFMQIVSSWSAEVLLPR
jgi:pimeloyl-ACP methyl ester carboxylesterase